MSDDPAEGVEHIWFEGVGVIPVREPTPEDEAQGRSDAAAADALHTPVELQGGMYHERAEVRRRVVPRLIARGSEHPETIPTFLDVLEHDPSPIVRGIVAFSMYRFIEDKRVLQALQASERNDSNEEVRENARYSLDWMA